MKKSLIILSALALAAVSCQKEIEIPAPVQVMSFEASMPELTKTSVDASLNVLWNASDLIDVYGYTEGQDVAKAVFGISGGAGTSSATFTIKEGESLGTYDSYFAVYPSGLAIKTASLPGSIEISSVINTFTSQAIVENSYDPAQAIMTARFEGGKLVFTHGVSYFRIKIPEDGITRISVTASSNAFQKRPVYSATDGSLTASNSGDKSLATVSGTFKKDSYYYLCAVPRKPEEGQQKMNGITVTYTHEGIEKPVTSTNSAIKDLQPKVGVVYDLGCPPVITPVPEITAEDLTLESDATGGSISVSIDAKGATGGVLTAAATEGKTSTIGNFTLGTASAEAVPFTCDANTESEARYAYVTLSYTYTLGTEKTVTKDVIITQKGVSSGVAEDYVWDFSSEEWTKELSYKGSKNSEISNWTSTVSGLTWTSIAKSKWNTRSIGGTTYTFIQAGGAYSESNGRFFSFTVNNAGTLKVTTTGTSSTADSGRLCTVKVGDSDPESKAGGSGQDDLTVCEFQIQAGDVMVYPTGNALRFFKIEFHAN